MRIKIGDVVVAIHDGGVSPRGPKDVPIKGRAYRIKNLEHACYGVRCQLEDMDPAPYKGYFFYVQPACSVMCFGRPIPDGYYFQKMEKADKEFVAQIQGITPKKTKSPRIKEKV